MEHIKKDIVVVGGGPGGLAAAGNGGAGGRFGAPVERNGYLGGQLEADCRFWLFSTGSSVR